MVFVLNRPLHGRQQRLKSVHLHGQVGSFLYFQIPQLILLKAELSVFCGQLWHWLALVEFCAAPAVESGVFTQFLSVRALSEQFKIQNSMGAACARGASVDVMSLNRDTLERITAVSHATVGTGFVFS